VATAIDGRNRSETGWAVAPETGKEHVALFETREPIANAGGTILTFTLRQHHKSGDAVHNVGCFRLSVTTHPPGKTLASSCKLSRLKAYSGI
jgi:hypothetical protein